MLCAISTSSHGIKDNIFLYINLFITWIIRFKLFVKVVIILIIMREKDAGYDAFSRSRFCIGGGILCVKATSLRCTLDFRYVPRKDFTHGENSRPLLLETRK